MTQCVVDQLRLLRQYGGVFRRGRVCGAGSKTSDTSSGAYSPYSSIYSASSIYSSLSDVSARSLNVEFDVSDAAAAAADSDVEDGFVESAPLHPVSAAFRPPWRRGLAQW